MPGRLTPLGRRRPPPARIQSFLAGQLASLGAGDTTVMVHGTTIAAARQAVAASGMRLVTTFDRVGVAVASGTDARSSPRRRSPE